MSKDYEGGGTTYENVLNYSSEQITVFEDKLIVMLKSGVEVEIEVSV